MVMIADCDFMVGAAGVLQPVWGADDAAAGDWAGLPVLDAPRHCALHAHAGLQCLQQVQPDSPLPVFSAFYRYSLTLTCRPSVSFTGTHFTVLAGCLTLSPDFRSSLLMLLDCLISQQV